MGHLTVSDCLLMMLGGRGGCQHWTDWVHPPAAVQFCTKYGSLADQKLVLETVRSNVVDLSKSKYGHHLVKKLIANCKKAEVPGGHACIPQGG